MLGREEKLRAQEWRLPLFHSPLQVEESTCKSIETLYDALDIVLFLLFSSEREADKLQAKLKQKHLSQTDVMQR